MKAFRYFTAVAAILAMAACQNDDLDLGGYENDLDAVRINATVGSLVESRSNPMTSSAFEDDDKITLQSEGQSVVYTYDKYAPDGPVWTAEAGKFLKWIKPTQKFTAYSPSDYTANKPVLSDQRGKDWDDANYIGKSDYMYFEGDCDKPDQAPYTINLEMQRQTARVVVYSGFSYNNELENLEGYTITLTISDGTTTVQPCLYNGYYYALLNPTTAADATKAFVTITLTKGDEKKEYIVRGVPVLEKGYSYTYNITIGKDRVEIGTVDVDPWDDGGVIEGNEHQTEEVITHEYVDLGLTTGTLWAAYNIGATAPEEAGDYFAWGETASKSDYSWDTYKYGGISTLTKYCYNNDYSEGDYTDNLVTLEATDDAATANWGSDWRMPTKTELEELAVECTWAWTTDYNSTGVAGYIVSSKAAGNTNAIFLPAASFRNATDEPSGNGSYGYYWCSSLDAENNEPSRAWNFTIYSDSNNDIESNKRYYGLSVRAVFAQTN